MVDANLRRPFLHTLFKVPLSPGLSELLAGQHHGDLPLHGAGAAQLMLLPAGSIPPNPSLLLNSPGLDALLVTLKEAYDLVLFDAPPLLHCAEVVSLAMKVDGVCLIAQAGATSLTALQEVKKQLNDVGAKVLGTILARYDG